MVTLSMQSRQAPGDALRRLLRAGLLTAGVDGLWACALTLIYGSTITRLWQGVAATLIGPRAFQGGTATAWLGLAMHICVAFTWSALFLILFLRSRRLRDALASRTGRLAVASIYGPLIWIVMSLAVIPFLTGRAPSIGVRWWIQLAGHVPFVGLPIVTGITKEN